MSSNRQKTLQIHDRIPIFSRPLLTGNTSPANTVTLINHLCIPEIARNSRARQGAPKAKFDAVYTSTEFDYLGFGLLLTTGS